jgi:glycerate kinase
MMKIVLAPDKFKGSLTGLEFCEAVEKGLLNVIPKAKIVFLPLADGGDGTIEVANYYLNGNLIQLKVKNPLFQDCVATYLYANDSKIAFIEMAEASGLKLLKPSEFDCKNATTFGTGQLIADAIKRGANEIILGIGGSATNDCGIGMATALGYRFLDEKGIKVQPIGASLSKIKTIDDFKIINGLKSVKFKIACDVTNPLYGKNGAAYIYAEQKGATEKDIKILDKGLEDFSKVLDAKFDIKSQEVVGGGAAGGMGIASRVFLNGELISGITLMKTLSQFDKQIKNANWIITGEGKLDEQTLSGKTIHGIIDEAKKHNINVAAFCGKLDLTKNQLEQFGIDYADDVLSKAKHFEDAITNSGHYITKIAEEFAQKING